MQNSNTFVGLDVHKEKINIAVADTEDREVRSFGAVNGNAEAVQKVLRTLISRGKQPHVVYEAGPTGFALQRYLQEKKIDCVVVAPSLIPKASGDRVKTDRRDALTLARLHRAGELSPIYVPTAEDEAMRDLTRARVDAMISHKRARQLLLSLLLRNGIYYPGKSTWGKTHLNWLSRVNLPHPTQQIVFQEYLHAIEEAHQRHEQLTEQIRVHVQTWKRYPLVPSEYSSGLSRRQGRLTKCGNTHARRLLIEASWAYQRGPKVSAIIRKRQENLPLKVCEIAWRAQVRLTHKYQKMIRRGKNSKLAVTAVARELLGFMWEIAKAI